jgi:hypothetical protein
LRHELLERAGLQAAQPIDEIVAVEIAAARPAPGMF